MNWKEWLNQFWNPKPKPPVSTTTTLAPPRSTTTTTTTTRTPLPPFPPIPPPLTGPTDIDIELLQAHNKVRTDNNKPPLVFDDQLFQAARKHSNQMVAVGKMAHEGIGDGTPWQRIQAAGYRFQTAAENIAMTYRSVEEVMVGWMKSDGHKANILGNTTEIGCSMVMSVDRVRYWTVVFATPATILVAGMSLEDISNIDSYIIEDREGEYQLSSIHINNTEEGW